MVTGSLLLPWLNGQDGEIENSTCIATATRLVELHAVIGDCGLIERRQVRDCSQPRATAALHQNFGAIALLHHGGPHWGTGALGPRLGPLHLHFTVALRCVASLSSRE